MTAELHLTAVEGVPEVRAGDDLAALIVHAAGSDAFTDGDVLVVAHKVVSKAEGRTAPGEREDLVFNESARVLRRAGDMVISETRHGFVCANAGVDASNVEGDNVVLLPLDSDLSARRLRTGVLRLTGAEVAVVVSDTFGRAWRLGQTNVAIGVAGMDPFLDYTGMTDDGGRELAATRICTADELAGAAELLMRKTTRICAVIVRGAEFAMGQGAAADIVRRPSDDLFR